jgi:hypothetical protein
MLYFLQVLVHIEQFIAPGAQTASQNSQTARDLSQQSMPALRSSQVSTQVSKDEVCGLQNVLLQNIVDHFANACKGIYLFIFKMSTLCKMDLQIKIKSNLIIYSFTF